MSELTTKIEALEVKAGQFDSLIDRVMDLGACVQDFEDGQLSEKGVINRLKHLINFCEPQSRAWIEKIEKQGYQEGALIKYVDSTFNGERILTVRATSEGVLYANTKSGEHWVGNITDQDSYLDGLDTIMCGLEFENGVELKK
jgi:hypothetical protein